MPGKVATTVLPARNCTCVTVAPPEPAVAVAVIGTVAPAVTTAPASGALRAIVGAELLTVTVTAEDVTALALESSATAVSVCTPATAGVHASVYGATVTGAPICAAIPLGGVAKNVTELIVEPATGAAEAVTVAALPTVAVELLAGAVIAMVVADVAVTVTADEVTERLLASMTRAVMLKLPAEDGTQTTEYGAELSVPTMVDPTRNWT